MPGDRIERYANVVGREDVISRTECGLEKRASGPDSWWSELVRPRLRPRERVEHVGELLEDDHPERTETSEHRMDLTTGDEFTAAPVEGLR